MSTWPQLKAREEGELVVLEPLGAEHEEGLFHHRHMKIPDGWRDTPWYSVIAPEWPSSSSVRSGSSLAARPSRPRCRSTTRLWCLAVCAPELAEGVVAEGQGC